MRDFGPWLHRHQSADPGMVALREAASDHASEWPFHSNEIDDYASFVAAHVPEAEKNRTLLLLGRKFEAWNREQMNGAESRSFWRWAVDNLGMISLICFGLLIAIGIIWALSTSTFLEGLASDTKARGLITFLVAISTISVALLTAISIFYMPSSELEARYSKAKDLMAILVGILGTILGFYFGSINNQRTTVQQPTIERVSGTPAIVPVPEPTR